MLKSWVPEISLYPCRFPHESNETHKILWLVGTRLTLVEEPLNLLGVPTSQFLQTTSAICVDGFPFVSIPLLGKVDLLKTELVLQKVDVFLTLHLSTRDPRPYRHDFGMVLYNAEDISSEACSVFCSKA